MAKNKKKEAEIPAAEWIVAALGALIVVAALATLVVDVVSNDKSAPRITIAVDSVVPSGGAHLVAVSAHNRGGGTAAELKVEATLVDEDGSPVERSEASLDYLPQRSVRRLGLYFRGDPRRYRIDVRPVGYQEP